MQMEIWIRLVKEFDDLVKIDSLFIIHELL